jgi:hypothetical protein
MAEGEIDRLIIDKDAFPMRLKLLQNESINKIVPPLV